MLQQTQVSAVQTAFKKWMQDFPDVLTLAKAKENDVLQHWQGLGYYSRAKNILRTAKILAENGGMFPQTRKELEQLPGIGAYTAGAILSLAFHLAEAILDGNLVRIFARLRLWDFLPAEGKKERDFYWDEAFRWAKADKAFLTNEALMELGRKICKRSNPDCENCPLQKICQAKQENRQNEFPKKKVVRYESWTGFALVVCDKNENFLLRVSPRSPFLKNQLMFPLFEYADAFRNRIPGIVESVIPWEKIDQCSWAGIVEHSITRYKIRCRVLKVQIKPNAGLDGIWVSASELFEKLPSSFAQKIAQVAEEDAGLSKNPLF